MRNIYYFILQTLPQEQCIITPILYISNFLEHLIQLFFTGRLSTRIRGFKAQALVFTSDSERAGRLVPPLTNSPHEDLKPGISSGHFNRNNKHARSTSGNVHWATLCTDPVMPNVSEEAEALCWRPNHCQFNRL